MAWIKLNATDPAAPAGARNVHFRQEAGHTGAQDDPIPTSGFLADLIGRVNAQTGTSYGIVAADLGKLVTLSNASSVAVSLPDPTTLAAGFWFAIQNRGAGLVTITPTSSNIDGDSTLELDTDWGVLIFSDGNDYFTLRGIGATGAGGAPDDAVYITAASEPQLSAEIVRQHLKNFFRETYPASPDSMDDEFDDTSGMSGPVNGLDARWTWRNQGAAAIAFTMAGWIDMTIPATSTNNVRIIEQTLPAGNWAFEALVSLEGDRNTLSMAGVAVIDGTNGDFYAISVAMQTSNTDPVLISVQRFTNVTTFLSNTFGPAATGSNKMFFRIFYTSGTTTLAWWISFDGIGWIRLGTNTDAVGVTRIGLFANEQNNFGLTKLHCDYFRRIA